MANIDQLKRAACAAIESAGGDLNELSQELWKHPELMFEEHHAHQTLTEFLKNKGFDVEKHYLLDTAFKATWGKGIHCNITVIL